MTINYENLIIIIGTTALFSSLLTAFLTSFLLRRMYKLRWKSNIDKQIKQIGIEVENGVSRAADKALPTIRKNVRVGVLEGVKDISKSTGQITSEAILHSLENFDPFQIFNSGNSKSS